MTQACDCLSKKVTVTTVCAGHLATPFSPPVSFCSPKGKRVKIISLLLTLGSHLRILQVTGLARTAFRRGVQEGAPKQWRRAVVGGGGGEGSAGRCRFVNLMAGTGEGTDQPCSRSSQTV